MFSLEVQLLVSSISYKHPEDFRSCSFCSAAPLHKNQCVRLGDRAVCVAHYKCAEYLLLGKHLLVLGPNLFSLVADERWLH